MDGNRMSALFSLLFAIYILQGSVKLDVGSMHQPGPGFFPLFGGIILLVFSTTVLLQSILGKSRSVKSKTPDEGKNIRVIAYASISLLIYTLIFEWLGFVLSTFLLLAFLLRILEHKKWWVELLTAGIISSSAYIIFNYFLKSQLPSGILETLL